MQKLAMIAIMLAITTLAVGTLTFHYTGHAFATPPVKIPHTPPPCNPSVVGGPPHGHSLGPPSPQPCPP